MKRKYSSDPKIWVDEAFKYYNEQHTLKQTYYYINTICFVSWRALRNFLNKEQGTTRNYHECQRLKRYNCFCIRCNKQFLGRSPTTINCDNCTGDSTPGNTNQKSKIGGFFKRLKQYGLNVEDYNIMLKKQNNLCGLCQIWMKQPCIDHDHETGKIRGLLCHNCNLRLGQIELLKDSILWLHNAEDWINLGKNI